MSIQGQTDVDSVEIDSEKAGDDISAERPVRNCRTPAKFNDFVMYWFNWQSLIIQWQ